MREYVITGHARRLRKVPFVVVGLIRHSSSPYAHVRSNHPACIRDVRMMDLLTAPKQIVSGQNVRASTYVIDAATPSIIRRNTVIAGPRR